MNPPSRKIKFIEISNQIELNGEVSNFENKNLFIVPQLFFFRRVYFSIKNRPQGNLNLRCRKLRNSSNKHNRMLLLLTFIIELLTLKSDFDNKEKFSPSITAFDMAHVIL